MKKTKAIYLSIIILLSIALIIVSCKYCFNWYFTKQTNLWLNESNKENNCNITVYEKGKPFVFGNSNISVYIYYNNKLVNDFITQIDSGGENLSDDNYFVEWQTDYVKIVFMDYTGKNTETYRFYYDDFYNFE